MIFEKICDLLQEVLGIDDEITMETNLVTDLNLDSLDMVELVMAAEDEFGFSVEDESMEDIETVADIVEFIKDRID